MIETSISPPCKECDEWKSSHCDLQIHRTNDGPLFCNFFTPEKPFRKVYNQIKTLQHMRARARMDLDDVIRKNWKERPFRVYVTEKWTCPTSPVGLCLYDDIEDRMHHHCLFCGLPDGERNGRKSVGFFVKIHKKIRDLREKSVRAEKDLYALVLEHFGSLPSRIHITELWDCPTSPVGLCVYNDIEDEMHDRCLFCHEPDERK